jgi:lysophospholipase L1-like esterase
MRPARSPVMSGWRGAWRGWLLRRSGSAEARAYRRQRVSTIRAALAAGEGARAFLAGDSHAELLGTPDLAGGATVNGGIGGTTAPVYAAELMGLPMTGRADLAVLFIGSNDIAAIHAPLTGRSVGRFARGVGAILDGLAPRAAVVWVAAIPPIRPGPVYPQVAEAVPVYNTVLSAITAARGVPFVDPFAPLRDGEGGLARPGATADGTHLADYRPIAEALAARWRKTGGPDAGPGGNPDDPACAPRHHRL